MSAPIRLGGSLKRLDRIVDHMRRPGRLLSDITLKQGLKGLGLVKDGFRSETDPYGKKWAKRAALAKRKRRRRRPGAPPLKKRKSRRNGKKILSKTNMMKKSWRVTGIPGRGWALRAGVDYALYHQRPRIRAGGGKLTRPRRMMIPIRHRGLPGPWRKAMSVAATGAIQKHFRRR